MGRGPDQARCPGRQPGSPPLLVIGIDATLSPRPVRGTLSPPMHGRRTCCPGTHARS
jgi:hypothetical protein